MDIPKVFLSYSHKDKKWKDRVISHLGVLSSQEILDLWDDQRISAGADWYQQIQKAMDTANVAILLVSANSLTSEFILREEVKRLLDRREQEGLPIFPIIVSPCAWETVGWLRKMQLRPVDGKPLSTGKAHQIDMDLSNIAKEICSILDSPQKSSYSKTLPEEPTTSSSSYDKEKSLIEKNLLVSDDQSLQNRMHTLMGEIDERINKLLPEKLISPTKNYSLQLFSSEKILTSLSKLGIPIEVGIEVIQRIEPNLLRVIEGIGEVTTSHIRKAVSITLYSLNTNDYNPDKIQEWGDTYARRYGNPDARIKVLHRDGTEENLDYKFLENTLIPHLIERIFDTSYEVVKDSVISKKNIERMSTELLSCIKSLNTYAIRYGTLINLAHDLAVQPPNPWFVESAFISKTVTYNLERAEYHQESMVLGFEKSDFSLVRHSSYECMHHSCAAVLAFYGTFLGCGYLGSLHNLICTIKIYNENPSIFKQFSNFMQIEGDLKAIDMSLNDFLRFLIKTTKHINCKDSELNHLMSNADHIFDIISRLINSRTNLIEKISAQKNTQGVKNIDELKDIVMGVLKRTLTFRLIPMKEERTCLWLVHKIDSPVFREIKPKILIYFFHSLNSLKIQDFDEIASNKEIEEARINDFCNTIVFITNIGYQQDTKVFVRNLFDRQNKVFFLTLCNIIDIHNSIDWIEKLEEFIINGPATSCGVFTDYGT